MSHVKAKMLQIRFLAFVRSFVRPFLSKMEFDIYVCLRNPAALRQLIVATHGIGPVK